MKESHFARIVVEETLNVKVSIVHTTDRRNMILTNKDTKVDAFSKMIPSGKQLRNVGLDQLKYKVNTIKTN